MGALQCLQVLLRQRFLKVQGNQGQTDGTKDGQRQQRDAPVEQVCQQPSERRAQAGDQTQTTQSLGHDPRALCRCVQVAHDGARAHHTRAHGSALQRAPDDQHFHGRRQRAGNRGQHVGTHADQQNRTTTKAVRQRAPDQLRHAKGQQQGGQRQLGLCHGGAKALGEQGQCRQVQVGGDWLQAQQQGQQQHGQARGHGGTGLNRHPVKGTR